MLEKLTPEQEALIPIVRDRWLNQLFDLKDINVEQLTEGVNWLYTFCKLEKPKIIICDSLIEAQIIATTLKNFNVLDNIGDNVRDNIIDNVVDNIGDNVLDNVKANIWNNIRDVVWNNVGANVWNNVRDNYEQFCAWGDINDYGWCSFYDYFSEISILVNNDFNSFKKLLQSNYFTMIQLEKVCIVVKNPKHILLNNQNQMNCIDDYAIKFKDDIGMYFINGFYLSDTLFGQLLNKKYTFEDFSKEENEEVKSVVISFYQQKFGDEFLFRFFSENLKEIDTFVDKKDSKFLIGTTGGMNVGVYTLFKGVVNNINVAYVRCYCPSTDRIFFLGVDPTNTNAKDAIASLYTIPKLLVNEIETISRQGEKFSTTFTEKGKTILKSLTEEQIRNLVSVSGEIYFKKMKYEY